MFGRLDQPVWRRDFVLGELAPLCRRQVGRDDVRDEALLVEVRNVLAAVPNEKFGEFGKGDRLGESVDLWGWGEDNAISADIMRGSQRGHQTDVDAQILEDLRPPLAVLEQSCVLYLELEALVVHVFALYTQSECQHSSRFIAEPRCRCSRSKLSDPQLGREKGCRTHKLPKLDRLVEGLVAVVRCCLASRVLAYSLA